MKKAAVLLSVILLTVSMQVIQAKDENEDDENGSIITDLPYSQEMEGEMYGALFGNVDDDIDIDVPVVEEPDKPGDKEDPDRETPSDQESGKEQGGGTEASTEQCRKECVPHESATEYRRCESGGLRNPEGWHRKKRRGVLSLGGEAGASHDLSCTDQKGEGRKEEHRDARRG